ncbi:siderophore ABC transporter substrate-binding protein [Psychromonas algicola]|uniref:siderophore ABC transporter substrate-binding protein n=1 Tax=Psychromonas algicola TaxID=2555642 RepID=UPI001068D09A|nr:siderophore ABC transporter substrate-binding protein [Psychromonas sp. RZ5]TEW52787.1 siderophore ABC transporter substrate-binding protein [Psychromonas sp. RZ5]
MKIKSSLFIISLFVSFYAFSKPIQITHMLGNTKLESEPQRVVVIGLGTLDALDAFAIEPVAITKSMHLPDYLRKYQDPKYASSGSLFEPDFETIYMQKPDLIITGPRASSSYAELSKIAPTVVFANDENKGYWESTQQQWRNLGLIFNIEEKVEKKIQAINADMQVIQEYNKNYNEGALIVMTSGGNVTAFGEKSRFSAIYQDFGFKQASRITNSSRHGDLISYEFISKTNPDILFVIDRDTLLNKDKVSTVDNFSNELIKTTLAYQKRRIVLLDLNAWYLAMAGVTATEQMIKDVYRLLP